MKNLKPFSPKDAEFLIGKVVKLKHNENMSVITNIKHGSCRIDGLMYSFEALLQNYTFLDGAPCGKENVWEPEIPEIGEWAYFWSREGETKAAWDRLKLITREGNFVSYEIVTYSFCSKTLPPYLGGEQII